MAPDDDSLFVRVEGYKEILQDLDGIRQIIENMYESLQVLKKVDQVKEKSITTFMQNIDRLTQRLNTVNNELPKLSDLDGNSVTIPEKDRLPKDHDPEEIINESLHGLHSELQQLKGDLDKLK